MTGPVSDAITHIRLGMEFAYQHGLHEFGYDPVKEIESALRFYAEQWTQDVDAELTTNGWEGSIGQMEPTAELMHDAGHIARAALSAIRNGDEGMGK